MTLRWISLVTLGLAVSTAAAQEAQFKTDKEKISYALGVDLGSQLRAQSVDIDPEIFAQALKTSLSGSKGLMTPDDMVVCKYRGTFVDGTGFDSSFKRNEPATFAVKGVVKGWTEALQLMPVGSKWQLFVPPELAYGERGAGNTIGPNSTLIFEIELISIKPKL